MRYINWCFFFFLSTKTAISGPNQKTTPQDWCDFNVVFFSYYYFSSSLYLSLKIIKFCFLLSNGETIISLSKHCSTDSDSLLLSLYWLNQKCVMNYIAQGEPRFIQYKTFEVHVNYSNNCFILCTVKAIQE